MLSVIHLENSRSDRLLWLLEELGLEYRVETYERDPKTQRAPAEMKALHPWAKAPMLRDGDLVLIESGAIFEYVLGETLRDRLAADAGGHVGRRHGSLKSVRAELQLLLSLLAYAGAANDAAAKQAFGSGAASGVMGS